MLMRRKYFYFYSVSEKNLLDIKSWFNIMEVKAEHKIIALSVKLIIEVNLMSIKYTAINKS